MAQIKTFETHPKREIQDNSESSLERKSTGLAWFLAHSDTVSAHQLIASFHWPLQQSGYDSLQTTVQQVTDASRTTVRQQITARMSRQWCPLMMESPEAVIPMSFITWSIVWNLNLIICDLQIQNFTRGHCCTLTVRGHGSYEFYDEINLLLSYSTINPCKNESLCSPPNYFCTFLFNTF